MNSRWRRRKGFDIGSDPIWDRLAAAFEKRHPVAHNLGVIDRKYLERVHIAEAEGREVRIEGSEIEALIEMSPVLS